MWNPFIQKPSSPLAPIDRDVLSQFRKLGWDLSQQFVVHHYLFVPSERAFAVKKSIEQLNFIITREGEHEGGSLLQVSHIIIPTDEVALAESIKVLSTIADHEKGSYDGWKGRPGVDIMTEDHDEDYETTFV